MLDDSKLRFELNSSILWVKKYVEKSNSKGIVIGLSGGKDSAVVLAIAVKAIGKDRVIAVSMPCHSNSKDFEDAKNVADKFGVKMLEVKLDNCYDELETELNRKILNLDQTFEISNESKVNMKPRLRMVSLYAIAQTLEYLVIGTGNLCEAMVRLYN